MNSAAVSQEYRHPQIYPFYQPLGQSDAAKRFAESCDQIFKNKSQSIYDIYHIPLLQTLKEAINEWQQSGAKEANEGDPALSYEHARHFINLIPFRIPPPEISIESDGEIAFDWIKAQDQYFSISIGPGQFCHYAAIFGKNSLHGKEELTNEFPQTVLRIIEDRFQATYESSVA